MTRLDKLRERERNDTMNIFMQGVVKRLFALCFPKAVCAS
jgi:hypothetical protein